MYIKPWSIIQAVKILLNVWKLLLLTYNTLPCLVIYAMSLRSVFSILIKNGFQHKLIIFKFTFMIIPILFYICNCWWVYIIVYDILMGSQSPNVSVKLSYVCRDYSFRNWNWPIKRQFLKILFVSLHNTRR